MVNSAQPTTAPDGGWGWVVMMASFIVTFSVFGVLMSGGVLYVAMVHELHVSRTSAAFIPSLAFGISFFIGPIATSLSSHFSDRVVIFAGALLSAFGALAPAAFLSLNTMTAFYGGVMGIGCGLIIVPNIAIVHTYFHRHRALATSIANAGGSIGLLTVPPLLEWVSEHYGLAELLFTVSALLLQICPCALLMKPLKSPEYLKKADNQKSCGGIALVEEKIPSLGSSQGPLANQECIGKCLESEEKATSTANGTAKEQRKRTIAERLLLLTALDTSIFRERYFYLICVSGLGFGYAWMSYLTILPDYVTTEGAESISLSKAVLLFSILSVSDLVFRIFGGWVMDKKWVNRRYAYTLYLLGSSIIMTAHLPSYTYFGYVTLAVIFGICISGVIILPPILFVDLLGLQRFPMAFGFHLCLSGVIIFFGAPSIAYIRERSDSYKPCILAMSATLYGAAILWIVDSVWVFCRRRSTAIRSKSRTAI